MKRWQDRGEVEDSEDDELSLEAESQKSQSPERPRKRAKQTIHPAAGPGQPIVLIQKPANLSAYQDGAALDWMRPKVAKTYGRRAKALPQAIQEPQGDDSRYCESENEVWTPVQNTSPASRSSPEHVLLAEQITTSSVSGDLPALNTIFDVSKRNDELHSSSSASSPLSERDVSPPPGFESPTRLLNPETAFTERSDPEHVENLASDTICDPPTSTAFIRRNLRARKAIQLNPYQFDKAQYIKLCKSRGVRPVRLVEQQNLPEEAESQSQAGSSQVADGSSVPSSPLRFQKSHRSHEVSREGLDYFDVGDSPGEEAEAHRLPKRRKLGHGTSKEKNDLQTLRDTARSPNPGSLLDEFSVPPSPPRTSSHLSNMDDSDALFRQTISGFRIPLGLTPAPLPTPQISSDAKRDPHEDMTLDSPYMRSARVKSRLSGRTRSIDSTTSSSEHEHDQESDADSEVDVKRLQRERKRIKGVLPASWLKIDLRAQQVKGAPEAWKGRGISAVSPAKAEPPKGVARKLGKATQRDRSPGLLDLPGGTSDSDDSTISRGLVQTQSRLDLRRERLSIAPNRMVDQDLMEDDFIDPMLPGHSRQRKYRNSGSHQPRITDSFRNTLGDRHDFAEQRRNTTDRKPVVRRTRVTKVRDGREQRRRPVVRLSIADVITSPHENAEQLPQFIKLALRRTKHEPDRGRHSPTHKVIRLATADDTREATSILRAWQQGNIAPRKTERARTNGGDAACLRNNDEGRPSRQDRLPNIRRDMLRITTPRDAPSSGHRSARKRRMQQTRIQPINLRFESHGLSTDEAGELPPARAVGRAHRRSPRPQQRLREAQLETLERDFDETHREAVFERRMQCMTENVARSMRHPKISGFQLDRYLQTDSLTPRVPRPDHQGQNEHGPDAASNVRHGVILAHRPRKSRAQRLDVHTREYRQPKDTVFGSVDEADIDEPVIVDMDTNVDISIPIIHGLSSYGTRYTTDFDMHPLDPGNMFHHSTFIGSGDFKDALEIPNRDLRHGTGHLRVQIDEEVFEWDAWNEDVVAQMTRIPHLISYALHTLDGPNADSEVESQVANVERNVSYLLRSIVRYLAKCVWFTDPVDRKYCVESLHNLVVALSETCAELYTSKKRSSKMAIHALQYLVVIAKQAVLLGDHPAVPFSLKISTEKLLLRVSDSLAKYGLGDAFTDLRSIYEDSGRAVVRASVAQDETIPLTSLVLLQNTLADTRGKGTLFWTVVSSALHGDVAGSSDVKTFEALWQRLFAILPALDIGVDGEVRSSSRLTARFDDWTLIKGLVSRVLELYDASSHIRGYSVNEYVRAVLSRCHCLISKWGWSRCEPALNTIFDFFARRSFSLLHKEEARGSPKFLEELDTTDVPLEVAPDDCSFHIFLKMVATGILGMRRHNSYADRKIISIIWRFIPNHNRTYRKDTDLHQTDLDALRNQHDLFSVLYYVSPIKNRIGVDLVLGLVDHSNSHREACRLSIRAWANIACFQASTSEPVEALQELIKWFSGTIKTTFAQYRLAKSEAEQDSQRAKQEAQSGKEMVVDDEVLETTIASNQRHIAAIIVDALAGLKRAILRASSLAKVRALVEQTQFVLIFDLFDPSQRRLLGALQEALLVCEAVLDMQECFEPASANLRTTDDDSQDFGDISAIEAFAADDQTSHDTSAAGANALLTSVGQFLSNVIGADHAADDSLLQRAIDMWTRLANVTVRSSAKSWSSYVDDYGTTAWNQLRDTSQKRKFTPYFMSQIINRSNGHEDVRDAAVVAWLLSLVEREAMLKFQHYLTSALLTLCGDEPLLGNLPFTRERNSDRYEITIADFRQRRLGLISSVLHNMRTHHDEVSLENTGRGQEVRSRYAGMLRQLMQTMKSNYQDLQSGQSESVANANLQGGYVDFVQNVVSFLQQYALGICQVDRFFTDSTAFPLPATDPTYVVGRLRSYIPKLSEASGRTQLAMFIQTVSERAATDNQQQYLVNQMAAAMGDVEEIGDEKRPSLRHVLLTSIFPAYLQEAISSACFWIPTIPMLEASGLVIDNLLYNFQIEDRSAVMAVVDCIISVLHSVCLQCDHALADENLLRLPRVLRTLGSMFSFGRSSLTIISYIQRTTSLGAEVVKRSQVLQAQATAIQAHLQDHSDVTFYHNPEIGSMPLCPWPDTRAVAEKQVRESVNNRWHGVEQRYFVQRGNMRKEVAVELGDSKDEEARLLQVIASFCRAFEATFGVPQQTLRQQRACDDILRGILV